MASLDESRLRILLWHLYGLVDGRRAHWRCCDCSVRLSSGTLEQEVLDFLTLRFKISIVGSMGRPRSFDDDVVIERAMDVFWTYGYANTSPAQLAEATGVAKGSLYNAFKSKRELFDRALTRYDRQVSELAGELLSGPGTTRECIRSALRFVVDLDLAQQSPRGCLVGNTAVELAGHDPQIARTIRTMQNRQTAALTARIEQGQREGDVGPDVGARAFAEFLATTLAGLRVMVMTHEAPTLYRVIDLALATLH